MGTERALCGCPWAAAPLPALPGSLPAPGSGQTDIWTFGHSDTGPGALEIPPPAPSSQCSALQSFVTLIFL